MKIPNEAGLMITKGISLARIVSEDSQLVCPLALTRSKSSKDS